MKPLQGLTRDKLTGKLTGLCAGLARHYDQPAWLIRVLFVIAFLALPVVTATGYLVASLLLPARFL